MRILVTGGAGFIGSHLAKYLDDRGHSVGILDYRPAPWQHIVNHRWNSLARCFPWDCRYIVGANDAGAWQINREDWDFCYHLASTVGVSNVLADPKECIENIVESTRAVLELGIPGMYFSTSEVYGKNTEPLTEDSECVLSGKTRWSYAAAKLCGEWLALAAGWKVVRLFNVIGPNQNPAYGAVVPKFLQCARDGVSIPVHGDGQQRRTFTSVFDVVQILDMLGDKKFDVVNISSANTVTILELAKLVHKLYEPKVKVIGKKERPPIVLKAYRDVYADGFEECPSRIADLGKLYRLIGNFKFRDLETSLKECINAQQEREVRFIEQHAAIHGS